jgi:hypothetical protein
MNPSASARMICRSEASGANGAGGWLWWSTGDHETLTWHALDLTTLRPATR